MAPIVRLVFGTLLLLSTRNRAVGAFSTSRPSVTSREICRPSQTRCYGNWLGDLWDEVIEFSTYGPAERRMLKAKREAADTSPGSSGKGIDDDGISMNSFQKAKQNFQASSRQEESLETIEANSLSLNAFRDAVVAVKENSDDGPADGFDGYALRDLLVSRWGIPLDIDFQRGLSQRTVYCTVLPVVFGSRKCRHITELDYLMHLQGVVEILHKHGNLELFRAFIETTQQVPRPGTNSVPFRLELNEEDLGRILLRKT